MVDFFASLGQPRRPWLDPHGLKSTYLKLSSEVHPDRFHGASQEEQQAANARNAELNVAYQHLREPKDRLLHLVQLERGRRPAEIQSAPPETMELFVQVAQVCRGVDAFLAEHAKVTSPILKATGFEAVLDWTDKLQQMQEVVGARRAALEERLKTIDALWDTVSGFERPDSSDLPWDELEQLYRQFSFLNRWAGQLQERIVQLSL